MDKTNLCLGTMRQKYLPPHVILALAVSALASSPVAGSPIADFTASPPTTVRAGELLFVDASLSQADPGGSVDLYEWQWSSPLPYQGQPADAFTFSADAVGIQQSHLFSQIGSYRVTLRITDDQSAMDLAQKVITVQAWRSPVAVPSAAYYQITTGTDLMLDGSASYDPDSSYGDQIIKYEWSLLGQKLAEGCCLTVPWANIEAALVKAGRTPYELENSWQTMALRVTDTTGRYHEKPVSLNIIPVPEPMTLSLLALIGLPLIGRRGAVTARAAHSC